MSGTERLLRETLRAPEHAVSPGIGLLDRARYEGERRRRRRRRRAVALSTASTFVIVGTGVALSPHVLPHPLVGRHASGPAALRVGAAPTAPAPTGVGQPPGDANRPTLWTEQIGRRTVTVVATYDGTRLCAQPDRAADADLRPARCAPVGSAGRTPGLLAGPVGGAGGILATDAAVSRLVLLTRHDVRSVVALSGPGNVYLGYVRALTGPAGGRVYEIVVPAGERVTKLRLLDGAGATIGVWTPSR